MLPSPHYHPHNTQQRRAAGFGLWKEFSADVDVRAEGSWQGDHLQHGLRVTFSAVVGVRAEGFVAEQSPTTLKVVGAAIAALPSAQHATTTGSGLRGIGKSFQPLMVFV